MGSNFNPVQFSQLMRRVNPGMNPETAAAMVYGIDYNSLPYEARIEKKMHYDRLDAIFNDRTYGELVDLVSKELIKLLNGPISPNQMAVTKQLHHTGNAFDVAVAAVFEVSSRILHISWSFKYWNGARMASHSMEHSQLGIIDVVDSFDTDMNPPNRQSASALALYLKEHISRRSIIERVVAQIIRYRFKDSISVASERAVMIPNSFDNTSTSNEKCFDEIRDIAKLFDKK